MKTHNIVCVFQIQETREYQQARSLTVEEWKNEFGDNWMFMMANNSEKTVQETKSIQTSAQNLQDVCSTFLEEFEE